MYPTIRKDKDYYAYEDPSQSAYSKPAPKVIELFSSNSTEYGISIAHKFKMLKKKKIFLAFKLSDVFIMLINVKMPAIVGMLAFISMINFMLS